MPAAFPVSGVQYVAVNLAESIGSEVFDGVDTVVHCAAETGGDKEAHERNTIGATRNILEAGAQAGVTRFIHLSSLAVLKHDRRTGPVSEQTPREEDLGRGPYAWAKAMSERLAMERGKELEMNVKVIRPGPLVDFESF